jgi:hypothetical protein
VDAELTITRAVDWHNGKCTLKLSDALLVCGLLMQSWLQSRRECWPECTLVQAQPLPLIVAMCGMSVVQ